MPITGDPATAVISGNVMFLFDTDFDEPGDAANEKNLYIAKFRDKAREVWDNDNAPLFFNGNRVKLDVTFGPYAANTAGWKIVVGKGKGDEAKKLFKPDNVIAMQEISFVRYAQEIGFMFRKHDAGEAPHELGHMVRLADRYINGYTISPREKKDTRSLAERFQRETPPLSGCFSKDLDDETRATIGECYVPQTNLMSGPQVVHPTLTNRQLGFVFSTNEEPRYSVNGWVFWRQEHERKNVPVWFSKGTTGADSHPGISFKTTADEANNTPCKDVKTRLEYCSFKPLLFGLRLHNHDSSVGDLARWAGSSHDEKELHKKFVRELSGYQ